MTGKKLCRYGLTVQSSAYKDEILWNKYVGTMRTAEFVGFGKSVILRRRMKIEANLTTYLTFLSAIVPGQIRFGSIADRAGAVIGYITFGSAEHRLYGFAVTRFVVRNEVVPFPILFMGNDAGKYIYFEFLIFRGMRIIKSPLPEGDISADEVNQPAVLLIKILNNRK